MTKQWTVCRGRPRWCGCEPTTHCAHQTNSIKVCLSWFSSQI